MNRFTYFIFLHPQSELASLQGRMSSLQQEAEENHIAIGQMKDAVETFIDSDTQSHQKLMDILNAAQKELSHRPRKQPAPPVMNPGGILPQLGVGAPVLQAQETAKGSNEIETNNGDILLDGNRLQEDELAGDNEPVEEEEMHNPMPMQTR